MEDVGNVDAAIRAQRTQRGRWIAVLAARQHGVVDHSQLLRLGFSASAISRLVASGRLHPMHRGVYAVGHKAVSRNGWMMAAALGGGAGALVSHRSAAALHALMDDSRPIIDVLTAGKRRNRATIVFHRSGRIHPDDRTQVAGIPVTSIARTLLDIAEVVPRRKLVYALERAEKRHVFDLAAIEALIARSHGRRGLKALTAAIREIEPEAQYTHEGMERLFIAFCRRYEIPLPALNVVVDGHTVDAYWREHNLVVELDSWEHHRSRRAFEEDRLRDVELTPQVLRITHRMLTKGPDELAASILRRLSASPSLAAIA